MRVALVTGVAGQDGRYLAERLLRDKWVVHGTITPGSAGVSLALPGLVQHSINLAVPESVPPLIEHVQPDVIFNLAGISSVARSWEEPAATIAINAVAVASMLEAAWQYSRRTKKGLRFVQASSAEIFGRAQDVPQHERTEIRPVSPYGAAKAFAHQLVGVYRERGLLASSAILYNHESPLRPHAFVTRKITTQVARIALGLDERLSLGNLEARRDWGWAPDYVDAMMRMALHPDAGDFVIATGVSHTVSEFVALAFEAAGVKNWEAYVDVDQAFVRPTDPIEMRGDAARAWKELGWRPTVNLAEIVRRMVEFDLDHERKRMTLANSETGP